MNETQAKQLLEDRRCDLERVKSAAEVAVRNDPDAPSSEIAAYDQHTADYATETYQREQAFSIIEMAEQELLDVELAEQRLTEGRYGICEICSRPIDEERLRAKPEARFCVEDAPAASA